MTTYQKFAISLPSRVAENARRAVRQGRAPSLSAYIAGALEQRNSREDLIEMLDEMLEQTGGPLTTAEERYIDWALAEPSRRPAKAPPRPTSLKSPRRRGK
jgi:hypothetical protein